MPWPSDAGWSAIPDEPALPSTTYSELLNLVRLTSHGDSALCRALAEYHLGYRSHLLEGGGADDEGRHSRFLPQC